MATLSSSPPTHSYESACKVVHDPWTRLNDLVKVLALRSQTDKRLIRDTYMVLYREDLIDRLHKVGEMVSRNGKEAKFSMRTCRALSLWMVDPHVREAIIARDVLEQSEPNYMAIVEILVARKSSHVLMIKQAYQARFRSHLEHDIASVDPPHPCQRILVAISTSHKAHQVDVSLDTAKHDAIRLFQTGQGSSSIVDESVVLEMLSKRSIAQLKLTFSWYKRIYGHSYTETLKTQSSRQFAETLRLVVMSICDPPKYYAQMIHESIKVESVADDKGSGSLARLMMSRAEADMDEIQKVYKNKYGVELSDSICHNIGCGDYTDFLVALTKSKTI